MEKQRLEDLLSFIRQYRSNSANFEKIYAKLQEEIARTDGSKEYTDRLKEIDQKQVDEYKQAKETGTTAWPEFENFIAEFETAINNTLKQL